MHPECFTPQSYMEHLRVGATQGGIRPLHTAAMICNGDSSDKCSLSEALGAHIDAECSLQHADVH